MTCTQAFRRRLNLFLPKQDFDDAEKNTAEITFPPPNDLTFDLQRFAEGDKTEEPTAKRRGDARKKGQVAKSQELNTAFVLLAGFLVIKVLWATKL